MKLDLYKKYKSEYATPRSPVLVATRAAKYVAVSGRGAPDGAAFQTAIASLYGVVFTIKMARKRTGRDSVVAKLDGLWWGGEPSKLIIDSRPATWRWKLMIAQTRGLRMHGRHHEIYLSDPRRVPPARLRTILRHPVRPR